MSDFVLHKGQRPIDGYARHYGSDTAKVLFDPAGATQIVLADGREGEGSCLGCGQPPCLEKHPSELALAGQLEAYPGDPTLDVCPTRAIVWGESVAVIDPDACIGCGLCVARCPYGAISLSGGTVAHVATADPDGLVTIAESRGRHSEPAKTGTIASLDCTAASALPASVEKLNDAKAALLVRNLLHEVGMNARVRRRGDTNMRIDAVGYSRSNRPFVAEIELTNSVLESPRALLEDVAILHARYGYLVSDIDPISVILSLPNVRSEYYQVIRDIEKVLQIHCRTITVGVLVTLLWSSSYLNGFEDNAFVIGKGEVDLASSLGISKDVLFEPYPGAFKPAK